MGHSHAHRAGDDGIRIGGIARTAVLATLAAIAVATVVGLVVWWPQGDPSAELAEAAGEAGQFAAPGTTFPQGEVVEVTEPCTGGQSPPACNTIRVDLGDVTLDLDVPPQNLEAGLEVGDRVDVTRYPAEADREERYAFSWVDRDPLLLGFLAVFLVAVLVVARWRGLFALVGLVFGGAVVWWFILPALLAGESGIGVALTGSSAIMFVVLYTTHGFSMRTSTALLGTIVGILLVTLLGAVAIQLTRLTGISDDTAGILDGLAPGLDFQSLFGCALVIAGLGVLNDVTITQASAVWELRASSPQASRGSIFTRGMRIGRDHIASTIYTLVFAYVGIALYTLMLMQIYGRPLHELASSEQLTEEIVRTLSASIGLVLAVPVTTALAALVASPQRTP